MSCQIIPPPPDGKPVKMILAHKIALDPTFKQIAYFKQACGTSRFTWNWALAKWNELYEKGEKPNGFELKKLFNATKYEEFPWLKDIGIDAHAKPFANLQAAFVKFFKKTAKRPRFKKKGKSKDSFYVSNDLMSIEGQRIRLPRIGWVRLRDSLRFQGKIMSAIVSRMADKWFVSIQVEMSDAAKPRMSHNFLGVDLGSRTAAMLSTGEPVQAPKPLRCLLSKLRRLSRAFSRKTKFSKNWFKAKDLLARLHARIANIRLDFIHKLTTRLARENQAICIEDLNVKGMMAGNLARAISDIGFYEIRRQLTYKSKIYGDTLVIADRWFPSSKTCSRCGEVKEKLERGAETFHCDGCGLILDRDYNAALNLLDYLLHALGLRVSACGGISAGLDFGSSETGPYEAGTRTYSLSTG